MSAKVLLCKFTINDNLFDFELFLNYLEAIDRPSAQLVLIWVFQCQLSIRYVAHSGVETFEVTTNFWVRHWARTVQGNLIICRLRELPILISIFTRFS